MKDVIICSIKEGFKIEDLLPNLPNSVGKIIAKRLFETDDIIEAYISKNKPSSRGLNEVQNKSDEEILSEAVNLMSEPEKKMFNTFELEIPDDSDTSGLIEFLNKQKGVNFAELDEMNFMLEFIEEKGKPNDPLLGELYAIKKLECQEAWKVSKGKGVIVAVVDTGVDYDHPDIKANMWTDVNGNYGYNFVEGNYDPKDDHGHGTHVAGTIAAVGDNSIGIIGIAPDAKIMALKGLSPMGGKGSNLAKCIRFAADHGAKIINNSWGPGRSGTVKLAIDYAVSKGAIVIFAAGNEDAKVDLDSAAGNSSTISVAAVNKKDKRADFSNFGKYVDISAPGVSIKSLQFDSTAYSSKSGTSMACPHVAGLGALIASLYPEITKKELLETLQASSDQHNSESGKPIGTGRVNAKKALDLLQESNSEQEEVKSFSAYINLSSNQFFLQLNLGEALNPHEIKFDSIAELKSCLDLMDTRNSKFSKSDNRLVFV